MSLSLSKLSWLVAIDGSELALTNCGKLPSDNDADGPGLSSKSDSGLDAYDKRDVVMGNRKSSERDSTGWGSVRFGSVRLFCVIVFALGRRRQELIFFLISSSLAIFNVWRASNLYRLYRLSVNGKRATFDFVRWIFFNWILFGLVFCVQ